MLSDQNTRSEKFLGLGAHSGMQPEVWVSVSLYTTARSRPQLPNILIEATSRPTQWFQRASNLPLERNLTTARRLIVNRYDLQNVFLSILILTSADAAWWGCPELPYESIRYGESNPPPTPTQQVQITEEASADICRERTRWSTGGRRPKKITI